MGHTFVEFYYHLIWATKGRDPQIRPEIEGELFSYIRQKCLEDGVSLHAVNGMPDHVHLACSLPARQSFSDFVRHMKGGSSHFINRLCPERPCLLWQPGYAAFTFARHDLAPIVAYIRNQKSHHAGNRLWPRLERDGE